MTSINSTINTKVIAHRGASGYAPENTFSAFKKAKVLGASYIEFDVMLTACGELIVFHDETLDRTTDMVGRIEDFTYEQLQNLDVGSWYHPAFAGEKIPRLSEVLTYFKNNQLQANIEIKAGIGKEEEAVQRVLTTIYQGWPKKAVPPLLSSFSIEVLRKIRTYTSTHPVSLLLDQFIPSWHQISEELEAFSININEEILHEKKQVEFLKTAHTKIFSYTVNDPLRALELFSWGVDAVFTDFPDRILEVV